MFWTIYSHTHIHFTGLLYILGAVFYALRVPERWFPGKFDLWVRCTLQFNFQSDGNSFNFIFFLRFTVSISSNIPRACYCGCVRSLSRHQRNGNVSRDCRRMHNSAFGDHILSPRNGAIVHLFNAIQNMWNATTNEKMVLAKHET